MKLLEPLLDPYEGMEFTLFEYLKNYYTNMVRGKVLVSTWVQEQMV